MVPKLEAFVNPHNTAGLFAFFLFFLSGCIFFFLFGFQPPFSGLLSQLSLCLRPLLQLLRLQWSLSRVLLPRLAWPLMPQPQALPERWPRQLLPHASYLLRPRPPVAFYAHHPQLFQSLALRIDATLFFF
jgi:hypothetical protein